MCRDISVFDFRIWLQKPPLESFFDVWKAVIIGHGHFRSFSKMIRSFGSIVYINIYLYNTYRGDLRPRKWKWPKMTVTDNDRIWLLKVIRKRMMFVCKIMIINGIVFVQYFCRVPCFVQLKQYIFLFALSQFLLFLRESWQNKSRNSSFSPFYSAFYPLLFLPSEGMKSVVSNPYFRRKSVFFIPRFYRKSVVFNYWFIGKVCCLYL